MRPLKRCTRQLCHKPKKMLKNSAVTIYSDAQQTRIEAINAESLNDAFEVATDAINAEFKGINDFFDNFKF